MTWGSVILAALQLIVGILTWAQQKKWVKAGEDAAIAQASLKVLEATEEGKRLYQLVTEQTDEEANDLWKRMLRDDPPGG